MTRSINRESLRYRYNPAGPSGSRQSIVASRLTDSPRDADDSAELISTDTLAARSTDFLRLPVAGHFWRLRSSTTVSCRCHSPGGRWRANVSEAGWMRYADNGSAMNSAGAIADNRSHRSQSAEIQIDWSIAPESRASLLRNTGDGIAMKFWTRRCSHRSSDDISPSLIGHVHRPRFSPWGPTKIELWNMIAPLALYMASRIRETLPGNQKSSWWR